MKNKILDLYKRYVRIVPGVRSYMVAAAFVFLLGLTITLLSWYVDHQRIDNQHAAKINSQAAAMEADIRNRLAIYEQILRGASGLFEASDNVNRDEWGRFVQQYDIDKNYPGMNSIGYIQYVKPSQLEAYLQARRDEGMTNIQIVPGGQRSEYGLVTFIEPYNEAAQRVIGIDVLSDQARVAVASKARDSGKVGVSGKLEFTSDIKSPNKAGFVMYVATYKDNVKPQTAEERQASLQGYLFASYRAQDFFMKTLDTSKFAAYSDVQIFDGENTDQKSLLYETANFKKSQPSGVSPAYRINVFDHNWTYRFAGPIAFNEQDIQRSNMILIGGITISLAISGFLFLVMLTRARAIVYAKQQEAQQAKDDLLSLASHQLRTPATAVKQYLGMILEGYTGPVDEKQLPSLQKAFASNERQLDTINQILYVAKADAGRLSISKTVFDLNLLVDDIVLDLEDATEEKNQKIVVERSSRKLKVNADESSLRMVIENLISNASKYSFPDTTIRVKTGTKDRRIFVSITDRGVGISKEDFDKLFKKFSRIDNDLSLQVGGSGIGLYIDKVLVELHGGRIDVESELGKGSTFTIFLPKNRANNLTDEDKADDSL